jgi:hypothetical protein
MIVRRDSEYPSFSPSSCAGLRRLFPLITDMAEAGARPDHRRLETAVHDAAADQAIASPELPFRILTHRALGIFGEVATLPVVLALRS